MPAPARQTGHETVARCGALGYYWAMRFSPLTTVLLLAVPGFQAWAADTIRTPDDYLKTPAYRECIALATTRPADALAKADEWLTLDQGAGALHCRAMALYGLRRYGEAAEALARARDALPAESYSLRAFVAKQTAATWRLANRADAALSALDVEVTELASARGDNSDIAKVTSDILRERALLQMNFGKFDLAARDLDHAVSLTPLDISVLNTRADCFESLGDAALARADSEAVLRLAPANGAAKARLARLKAK